MQLIKHDAENRAVLFIHSNDLNKYCQRYQDILNLANISNEVVAQHIITAITIQDILNSHYQVVMVGAWFRRYCIN